MMNSYVLIKMDDRLDDAKALSPMLLTEDVRHTLRMVRSSDLETQV